MTAFGAASPTDLQEVQRLLEDLRSRQVPVPQARAYNSANLSIANNTETALTFNSERYDNGDLHSTSANTGRLTASITGLYTVGCCVRFASNATGRRLVSLWLNGATVLTYVSVMALTTGDPTIVNVGTEYQLTAGDYMEVRVLQTSGGALNVEAAGNYSPEFWMSRKAGFVNQGV